jgi:NAD+ dependent glucose-6-phosphate dehydrogenase
MTLPDHEDARHSEQPLPILYDGEDEDDPDAEEELDEEEVGEEPRTILITGASGNIGRKLRAAWDDVYDLVLIDIAADPDDPDVVCADLSELDEEWMALFHGVDTVIHLAATPNQHSSWEELVAPNLDAVCNVFHAAALAGVERIVFASSNHAMGGYRELGDIAITVDLPPRPGNPYGAAKLMAERLGRSLSGVFDLTFVALRLGWVQPGANRPETLPDEWHKELWLSDNDMVRLFVRAVEADLGDRSFVVVNGMSNNHGTRWDLSDSFEAIGYVPKDDAFAEDTRHPGPRSLG